MGAFKALAFVAFVAFLAAVAFAQTAGAQTKATRSVSTAGAKAIVTLEVTSEEIYEKQLTRPVWPGGDSGITIGAGYDLGAVSFAQFKRDWQAKLAPADFEKLAAFVGIRGSPRFMSPREAKAMWAGRVVSVNMVRIPWQVAMEVFETSTLPKYAALTERTFPNCDELDDWAFTALVSLVVNRGASMSLGPGGGADPRLEMRTIRDLMAARQFGEVPSQMRAMSRLWKDDPMIGDGMTNRRNAEALMFERGLKPL